LDGDRIACAGPQYWTRIQASDGRRLIGESLLGGSIGTGSHQFNIKMFCSRDGREQNKQQFESPNEVARTTAGDPKGIASHSALREYKLAEVAVRDSGQDRSLWSRLSRSVTRIPVTWY